MVCKKGCVYFVKIFIPSGQKNVGSLIVAQFVFALKLPGLTFNKPSIARNGRRNVCSYTQMDDFWTWKPKTCVYIDFSLEVATWTCAPKGDVNVASEFDFMLESSGLMCGVCVSSVELLVCIFGLILKTFDSMVKKSGYFNLRHSPYA